jgi:hypothetical protein
MLDWFLVNSPSFTQLLLGVRPSVAWAARSFPGGVIEGEAGLALAILEAVSLHGWDNLTLQLGASGLAFVYWA